MRKVFFAWQSDAPSRTNRGLIRSALDLAARADTATIEDADREDDSADQEGNWVVDQDTQDIPGSPDIGQAILDKIAGADAFVADLTLIDGQRPAPNPNVLLEYGYALKALGPDRIIGVINTAYGPPEDLPFDIRGKRCVKYFFPDDPELMPLEHRQSLRKQIAFLLRQIPQRRTGETHSNDFEPVSPFEGENSNRFAVSLHGHIPSGFSERKDSEPELMVWLRSVNPTDPFAFIRLIPTKPVPPLSPLVAREKITQSSLEPLFGYKAQGQSYRRRNQHGAAAFSVDPATAGRDSVLATTAVELFQNRELWSVDTWLLDNEARAQRSGREQPFIPPHVLQEGYLLALSQYLKFARDDLGLETPIRWVCGLMRIERFRLLMDHDQYSEKPFKLEVVASGLIEDYSERIHLALRPFFVSVWEEFGLELGPGYEEVWSAAQGFDLT